MMKQRIILMIIVLAGSFVRNVHAQRYEVLNYHLNDTPAHGIKIKTRIPFVNWGGMPTVRIEGYFYGNQAPIGLSIVWYTYNNTFSHARVSSWGAITPPVYLSNENGYISIFIDKKPYYPRFAVSVYSTGRQTDQPTSFTGWSVVDEPLGGTSQLLVPYTNQFAGKVIVDGHLLIDKTTQTNTSYKLDVNGNIRANKVVVNTSGADYVFDSTYHLISLDSLDKYLKKYHHLSGIPSAERMRREGLNIGDAYVKLLEKMEELTRYVIELERTNKYQQHEIEKLKQNHQ